MEKSALSAFATTFDALGIGWVLIGALAANRYRGSPRFTKDVDVLISDERLEHARLEAALCAAGWDVTKADAEGELLRLRHPVLGRADVLVAGTEYQREAILRARVEKIEGGAEIPVLRVEDVIVHKLIAGRAQDIADIEAILDTRLRLDRAFIERWAEFWDVVDRWRAVSAAG